MSEREQIKAYLNDRWRAAKADLAMIEKLMRDLDAEVPAQRSQRAFTPTFTDGEGEHGKSVRLMTEEILRREDRWMRSRDVYLEIVEQLGPQAGTRRLLNNVRTSLHALKRDGYIDNDGQGQYRRRKVSEAAAAARD